MTTDDAANGVDTNEAPPSEIPDMPASALEAITEKMEAVFAKGKDASEDGVSDTKNPVVSARETARRAAVAKEQKEELDEEGLTGVDNPEGTVKDAAQDKTIEVKEEVKPPEETAELPTLDPNLRFVANEFGWKNDKIDALLKADPEMAQETFSRMADAYTNLSRQMLDPAGSQLATGTQTQVEAAQPKAPALDALFSKEALASFAETNGQEIVDKFLKPFAEERQAMRGELDELRAYVAVQQRSGIAQEYNAVVNELAKPEKFGELYGLESAELTEAHKTARNNLAKIADQIRSGAKQQGRELSVTDALKRAHLIVSADFSRQVVRKEITGQVQKRSKQITAAPTQRRNPTLTGVRSDEAAAEAYARKAAELGMEA